MAIRAATLTEAPTEQGSAPFVPSGSYQGDLNDFDYVEEEWFAEGEVDGHPYRTTVFVRRPRDPARFSGTVVVEPLHAASAAPIWIYTSSYLMRSGHGWACICSQKTALEDHVKPSDTERYSSLSIWSDAPPLESSGLSPAGRPRDFAAMQARMQRMAQVNGASTPILAQVGAALAEGAGPFAGFAVDDVLLAGHSQTGGVATQYILNGHDALRLADGAPVYHGFFPSGSPSVAFGPYDVPIVQVLSDGDISNPHRPGREGRRYRRPDSDEPGDRYRLYELAGVAHMGTRYPPYSNNAMWQTDPLGTAGNVPTETRMNSLPHNELFSMSLHRLVQWVAKGITPPRAERLEVGADEFLVKDEYGNTLGGVRCAQIDVPRLQYFSNPGVAEDGTPAFGVVGVEKPLSAESLERRYQNDGDYVEQFNRRLDELIALGWFLEDDAPAMRAAAEKGEA
jgi:hypothetical protein